MSDVVEHIGSNAKIGKNVMIWHFTYVGNDTEIGDNTKIGSLVHEDYKVKIGGLQDRGHGLYSTPDPDRRQGVHRPRGGTNQRPIPHVG